jgi:hypothetical protein
MNSIIHNANPPLKKLGWEKHLERQKRRDEREALALREQQRRDYEALEVVTLSLDEIAIINAMFAHSNNLWSKLRHNYVRISSVISEYPEHGEEPLTYYRIDRSTPFAFKMVWDDKSQYGVYHISRVKFNEERTEGMIARGVMWSPLNGGGYPQYYVKKKGKWKRGHALYAFAAEMEWQWEL